MRTRARAVSRAPGRARRTSRAPGRGSLPAAAPADQATASLPVIRALSIRPFASASWRPRPCFNSRRFECAASTFAALTFRATRRASARACPASRRRLSSSSRCCSRPCDQLPGRSTAPRGGEEEAPRAQAIQQLAVVAHQQADAAVAAEGLREQRAGLGVHVVGRLVEAEHRLVAPESHGDLSALAFAVAQGGPAIGPVAEQAEPRPLSRAARPSSEDSNSSRPRGDSSVRCSQSPTAPGDLIAPRVGIRMPAASLSRVVFPRPLAPTIRSSRSGTRCRNPRAAARRRPRGRMLPPGREGTIGTWSASLGGGGRHR